MDEDDFIREIGVAWSVLKERLNLGRFFISPVALRIDAVYQSVALSEESTYEQIFRAGLTRSYYNILLEDYAYFQFGWTAENMWRLGYFPNPWVSGAPEAQQMLRQWEILEELGALNHEETSDMIADMPYVGAVPPIRYEYAAAQYREFAHPAAHFHIGRHAENRWPSAIAVGPKAFALIIAKLYYPQAWANCSSYHGASGDCIENVLLDVMADTRLVHDFSAAERRSFHFGKNTIVRG